MRTIIDGKLADTFIDVWGYKNGTRSLGWSELRDRHSINCGWCYQFAIVLKKLFPKAEYRSTGHHCWIELNGLHYDAIHLSGSPNPLDAPCAPKGYCDLCDKFRDGHKLDYQELKDFWDHEGASGPVREDTIEDVITTYLKIGGSTHE